MYGEGEGNQVNKFQQDHVVGGPYVVEGEWSRVNRLVQNRITRELKNNQFA